MFCLVESLKALRRVITMSGFLGAVVFCSLNVVTDGLVPGGALGGGLGALVFGGGAGIIYAIVQKAKKK